ncbi:arylsulfatase [Pseudonocardia alni]|uniref:arylsulfatase n=1 Tax=Pseudonocardia alni TaxID=33907 RepID=UPI00280C0EA0|nr:arylsulfatase [Pseudonocardia alni]
MSERPHVLLILADDLGYSDLGCFGGEIHTPTLDRLAEKGVRLLDFHNTPRCSPSRASLLTGLHPHQAGVGILTSDDSEDGGYHGNLDERALTLAEVLGAAGYETAIRGKWHLSSDTSAPNGAWPTERGFESFWGTLTGCGSYYNPGTLTRDTRNVEHEAQDPTFFYTDRIADEAISFLGRRDRDRPFFLYLPFTAPHWPLHARSETIARYRATYERGWDVLRDERLARQRELGVVSESTVLSERDPSVPPWAQEPNKKWKAECMAVYAAQVEEMDAAIGRVVEVIDGQGELGNTIIVFLSDNGASDESLPMTPLERFRERSDIVRNETRDGQSVDIGNDPRVLPGGEDTYESYGRAWANLSNTPFRRYKLWTYEGGISAPLLVHWPAGGLAEGAVVDEPYQLVHMLPTLLEATGVVIPETTRNGQSVRRPVGVSMLCSSGGGGTDRAAVVGTLRERGPPIRRLEVGARLRMALGTVQPRERLFRDCRPGRTTPGDRRRASRRMGGPRGAVRGHSVRDDPGDLSAAWARLLGRDRVITLSRLSPS